MRPHVFRIATRRSLLALAQATWVGRQLEARHRGQIRVEWLGIDTRGDRIQDVPLQSVAGKEFFVAEIDDALRDGRADAAVHSLKDLSTDRPHDLVLAATPARELPNDVVLFRGDTADTVRHGRRLKIGTSSPRRIENLRSFLRQALPTGAADLDLVEIRGNVNTRISRLHEAPESPRALDGVVLALAGLNRLAADSDAPLGTGAGQILKELVRGLRWMVLPIPENPTAPGQGALAVECRQGDSKSINIVAALDDPTTRRLVARERSLFSEWGGGCHQKFGITVLEPMPGLEILYSRGVRPDGMRVDACQWPLPARLQTPRHWDGIKERGELSPLAGQSISAHAAQEAVRYLSQTDRLVWVSHSRAMPIGGDQSRARLWVPGTKTWFQLAKRGLWVEGSAEGFGFDWAARRFFQAPALQLHGRLPEIVSLTHADSATDGGPTATRLPTYVIPPAAAYSKMSLERLQTAETVYWGSFSQYQSLCMKTAPGTLHCAGPGSTSRSINRLGRDSCQVFPDRERWLKWVEGKDI